MPTSLDPIQKSDSYCEDAAVNVADFSNIEQIVQDIANGKPVIMIDNENRENEGDLIIAAESITPEIINFMITHCRGLVCMPISRNIAEQLSLRPMVDDNTSQLGTAFTVSIGAKQGITTGISAYDRAKTISVAVDKNSTGDDLSTPGHVFPLIAKDGGVTVRAGHTEAATDLAEMAGFRRAAVICEIIKDDGTMARVNDLVPFANKHGFKIGTIESLINYKNRK